MMDAVISVCRGSCRYPYPIGRSKINKIVVMYVYMFIAIRQPDSYRVNSALPIEEAACDLAKLAFLQFYSIPTSACCCVEIIQFRVYDRKASCALDVRNLVFS